jgi:TetR/AcrR family transcriptional regulator, transcriptional repressor for nem operon
MVDAYVKEKDFTRGCFVGIMCQEMADTNVAVADKAEYLFRRYTAALARCICELQDAGESRRMLDADKLAEFIFNSWEGAMLRMKSSRNTQPLNAFLDTLKMLLTGFDNLTIVP